MPNILRKLKLTELSLVDEPANKGAKVSIFKRDDVSAVDVAKSVIDILKYEETGAQTFNEIVEEAEARRRQWQASEILYPLFSALETSLRSIAADAEVTDKGKLIQSSVGEFLAAVKDKLPDVEEELDKALKADPALAGLFTREPQENDMDPTKKVAELETQVAELNKKLDDATKASTTLTTEKAEVEKKLETATKELDDLKKSIDLAKNDEAITIGEQVIKKSVVGDGVFAAMKAQHAEIEKGKAAIEIAKFEIAAEKDYGHLTGDTKAKAEALHALSKMDEGHRKVLEAMLKGGEEASVKLMKSTGTDNAGNPDDPQAQLDKLVNEEAEKSKVTKAVAYDNVIKTAKGQELYEAIYHTKAA